MRQVPVLGSSVAGLAAAAELRRAGMAVRLHGAAPRTSPVVMVGPVARHMLDELFPGALRHRGHMLRGRFVRWPGRAPGVQDVPSVAIDLADLVAALEAHLPGGVMRDEPPAHGELTEPWVDARGAQSAKVGQRLVAGRRRALFARVAYSGDPQLASIRSQAGAWCTVIPFGPRRAQVQLFLPQSPADPESRFEAALDALPGVTERLGPVASAATAPSIAEPLSSSGWISAGARAMCLDPLCGDGVVQSLRSALLAACVLRQAHEPGHAARLAHHRWRHWRSFVTHLRELDPHYAALAPRDSWAKERRCALEFATEHLSEARGNGVWTLRDRRLVPVPIA